jgi:hypothetical protein
MAGLQVPLGLSKKDAALRQKELLGSGKSSLVRTMLEAVCPAAAKLLGGKNSADLLTEIVRGGSNGAVHLLPPSEAMRGILPCNTGAPLCLAASTAQIFNTVLVSKPCITLR